MSTPPRVLPVLPAVQLLEKSLPASLSLVSSRAEFELVCGPAVVNLYERALGFLFPSGEQTTLGDVSKAVEHGFSVTEIAWENLHSLPWTQIAPAWRLLYAQGSLLMAVCSISQLRHQEAISWLDKALLLGLPRDPALIDALIEDARTLLNDPGEAADSRPSKRPRTISSRLPTVEEITAATEKAAVEMEQRIAVERRIEKVECPSLEDFAADFLSAHRPVVITEAMDHWPALSERPWSDLNYLQAVAGVRTVPIEIGSSYTHEEWSQKLLTFSEFLEEYIVNPTEGDREGREGAARKKGYLAQHQLFDQIPQLSRDICIPDHCFAFVENPSQVAPKGEGEGAGAGEGNENADAGEEVVMNAWFGPKGTVSPAHFDPSENLLAQVVGCKYIRLFSPSFTEHLYPYPDRLLHNTSQVSIESPDLGKFPRFSQAEYQECVLRPGEMLFIPKGWWHYVKSLSISFSVSFWFK